MQGIKWGWCWSSVFLQLDEIFFGGMPQRREGAKVFVCLSNFMKRMLYEIPLYANKPKKSKHSLLIKEGRNDH
jgi:hypothetical protein